MIMYLILVIILANKRSQFNFKTHIIISHLKLNIEVFINFEEQPVFALAET